MAKSKFQTQFSHDRLEGLKFELPSRVQPQFAYECDINNIVAGCVSTLDNVRPNLTYLDTTTVPDLEQASNMIAEANSQFEKLPSDVRARFGNDPKQLLAFVSDKKNYDEAVKLGFITPNIVDTSTDITAGAVTQPIAGGSVDVSEPSAQ